MQQRSQLGCFPGSVSIPAAQLAAALQQSGQEFKRQYRCSRPAAGDPVVLYSRSHTRAAWAAQVAMQQGLRNCFVLLQVSWPSPRAAQQCWGMLLQPAQPSPRHWSALHHPQHSSERLGWQQGICGWHLDAGVKAYQAYGEDDPPPEPEPSQVTALRAPAAAPHIPT